MNSFMIGPDTSKIVSSFNNYGCWCDFRRSSENPKSQAKSKIDALCKNLKLNYSEILKMKNNTCNPYKTGYKNKGFAIEKENGFEMKFRPEICSKLNYKNICAVLVCQVEMDFVMDLHDYLFFEEVDDRDVFSHEN